MEELAGVLKPAQLRESLFRWWLRLGSILPEPVETATNVWRKKQLWQPHPHVPFNNGALLQWQAWACSANTPNYGHIALQNLQTVSAHPTPDLCLSLALKQSFSTQSQPVQFDVYLIQGHVE